MTALKDAHADAGTIHGLLSGNRCTIESFVRDNAGWMHRVARRYLADDALTEDCV
jgi:hypothetical protein